MWGECPLRGAGHLCLQGGLALGETAGAGPRHTGPQRWDHLFHCPHLHLHPRTRAPAPLHCCWSYLAVIQHHFIITSIFILAVILVGGARGYPGGLQQYWFWHVGAVVVTPALSGCCLWCVCAFSDSVRKCAHILCTEACGPMSNCAHIADSAALHQRAKYGNHKGWGDGKEMYQARSLAAL